MNSVQVLDPQRQRDLFARMLDEPSRHEDMVNQALEVLDHEDGSVVIDLYDIPEPD